MTYSARPAREPGARVPAHTHRILPWSSRPAAVVSTSYRRLVGIEAGESHRLWAIPAAVLVYGNGFAGERGVLEFDEGVRYEGEIRDGKAHGQGVMTKRYGTRYEGGFREGGHTGRAL